MPKQGLGLGGRGNSTWIFSGRWDRLHLDPRWCSGYPFVAREAFATTTAFYPAPKSGRWTYRIVSAEPGSILYFCPEEKCRQQMLPTMGEAGREACDSCGGKADHSGESSGLDGG